MRMLFYTSNGIFNNYKVLVSNTLPLTVNTIKNHQKKSKYDVCKIAFLLFLFYIIAFASAKLKHR